MGMNEEQEDLEAARLATLAQFPVGTIWRHGGQERHIHVVIDNTQFVYRVWNPYRGAWSYDTVYWYLLWIAMQEGELWA